MDKIESIVKSGELFEIKVSTKSSSDGIYMENGLIKVKIREIPENGKANRAIVDLFSKTFKIPKGNIKIVKGERSSTKLLRITN